MLGVYGTEPIRGQEERRLNRKKEARGFMAIRGWIDNTEGGVTNSRSRSRLKATGNVTIVIGSLFERSVTVNCFGAKIGPMLESAGKYCTCRLDDGTLT